MSVISVFSVRDVVSDTYGRPFYSFNTSTALRSLKSEVNNKVVGSVLFESPDDFELYLLGEFDDETGRFDLLDRMQFVVRCSSLVLRADAISDEGANRAGNLNPEEVM